jgi:lincosamide and streptogramin A transport system ATP-binding/permease protein
MSKLLINNLYFHYATYFNPIYENVNLNLDSDWKLGLIGRNGRGKTTFLKLLTSEIIPVKGNIVTDVKIEYFPYKVNKTYHNTLDVMKENIANLKSLEENMDQIIYENNESRFDEYQSLLENYQLADGFNMESRIHKELNLMNLDEALLERNYETLSGGEKTKIQIIILFLRMHSYVLLDEPTNHLDIEGKTIISDYLSQKKGFLVVSHDRDFLDQVVDHVLSINKTSIELEKGNYTTWKENKDKKESFEFRTKARLEKEIDNLSRQAKTKRIWGNTAEQTKNQHGKFERSSGSRAAQFMMHAKNAEENARRNLIEKNKLLIDYESVKEFKLEQDAIEHEKLLQINNLTFGYGEKLLLDRISLSVLKGDRIWIKGKNGCGKSTLINLITQNLSHDYIDYCPDLKITVINQEPLFKKGFVQEIVANYCEWEQFTDLCTYFDIEEKLFDRPIETYSDGEKRKIDIARALCSKHQLLILDEALNYMDVYFREQLENAILEYQPTLLFVEHDERFGRNIATKILKLD